MILPRARMSKRSLSRSGFPTRVPASTGAKRSRSWLPTAHSRLTLRLMPIRRIAFVAFLLAATLCVSFAQTQADDPGDSLLAFLNQSIDWYHRVQISSRFSNDPSDSIYTTYNRNASLQAVSLIFDFGRIQAEQIQLDHPHDASTAASTAQPATLSQRVAGAQDKVKQTTAGLELLERQAAAARGKKLQTINDQIAELKSDLELARARLEVLQSMNAFTSTGVSAGLLGKIDELERTVPEARIARTVELSARSSHPESNSSETPQNGNHGRATSGTLPDTLAANSAGVSSANGSTSSSTPSAALAPFSPLSVNTRTAAAAPAKQPSNGIISLAEDLNSLHGKARRRARCHCRHRRASPFAGSHSRSAENSIACRRSARSKPLRPAPVQRSSCAG